MTATDTKVRCKDCLHAQVKPRTKGEQWRCEAPTREVVGGMVYDPARPKYWNWSLNRWRDCAAYEGHDDPPPD